MSIEKGTDSTAPYEDGTVPADADFSTGGSDESSTDQKGTEEKGTDTGSWPSKAAKE